MAEKKGSFIFVRKKKRTSGDSSTLQDENFLDKEKIYRKETEPLQNINKKIVETNKTKSIKKSNELCKEKLQEITSRPTRQCDNIDRHQEDTKETKKKRRSSFLPGRIRKSLSGPLESEYHLDIPTTINEEERLRLLLQKCLHYGLGRLERWESADDLIPEFKTKATEFCEMFGELPIELDISKPNLRTPNPLNVENSILLEKYIETKKRLEEEKQKWNWTLKQIKQKVEELNWDFSSFDHLNYLTNEEKQFLGSGMNHIVENINDQKALLQLKIDWIHQFSLGLNQFSELTSQYYQKLLNTTNIENEFHETNRTDPTPRKIVMKLSKL